METSRLFQCPKSFEFLPLKSNEIDRFSRIVALKARDTAQRWLAPNEITTATNDPSQVFEDLVHSSLYPRIGGCSVLLPPLSNGVHNRFLLHSNDIHAWLFQGLSRMARSPTPTITWKLHAHARDIISSDLLSLSILATYNHTHSHKRTIAITTTTTTSTSSINQMITHNSTPRACAHKSCHSHRTSARSWDRSRSL